MSLALLIQYVDWRDEAAELSVGSSLLIAPLDALGFLEQDANGVGSSNPLVMWPKISNSRDEARRAVLQSVASTTGEVGS